MPPNVVAYELWKLWRRGNRARVIAYLMESSSLNVVLIMNTFLPCLNPCDKIDFLRTVRDHARSLDP